MDEYKECTDTISILFVSFEFLSYDWSQALPVLIFFVRLFCSIEYKQHCGLNQLFPFGIGIFGFFSDLRIFSAFYLQI